MAKIIFSKTAAIAMTALELGLNILKKEEIEEKIKTL